MPKTDGGRECPHCGAALAGEQLICARCGEIRKRSRRLRCRHCGTANSQSQQMCVACGEPLKGNWIRPGLIILAIVIGLALLLITAAWLHRQGWTQQPIEVSTERVTSKVAATPAEMLTPTPAASITPRSTLVPTATQSPSPTSTPTWTLTPTRSPTPTSTTTATASSTPTSTNTPTPSPSPTATMIETLTPTPSLTATPFIYSVKAGDTLYDIAARYDTTVNAIMEANGLTSTRLSVGQQLIIPLATSTPVPTPTQS